MMFSWKLSTKFSLFLVIVFLIGSGLTILTLSQHLNYQAEQAVKERAEILISTMQAARNYTRDNVQPALERNSNNTQDFKRESIPNFAAQSIFSDFRQQTAAFQDFSYKEAALNPTNSADLADDFEAQIFAQMQSMPIPSNLSKDNALFGYRTLEGKRLFYLARPLHVDDASCLVCHGNPSQAPQNLVEMYGDKNGFGWQLNDLVATQIIYVPADTIFNRGRENLWTVTTIFLSIFSAIFVVINLLLWRTVTHPLGTLTTVAKQISNFSFQSPQSNLEAKPLAPLTRRQDEPGQLARAFEYMVQVLSQREQELQQAVQARTQSLETEMRERQAAQDALQTYNHAINHDLRNLVMGISMLVQGILRRAAQPEASGKLPSQSPESSIAPESSIEIEPAALTMIHKSCDRQLNLMNSLVEVRSTEIWRTVLRSQTLCLSALASELEANYHSRMLNTTSTLEHHISSHLPSIQADPSQLKRVFENLINNALKYNPQGVNIVIAATHIKTHQDDTLQNNNEHIRCTITDNGIGINAQEKHDLFKIYARGQSDRKVLGDGLGLYICRKIIEAHGGNIGIEAVPTGGAKFWFTLPV